MEGTQIGTLYKPTIKHVLPISILYIIPTRHTTSTALTITSACHDELALWHNRMGHVNIHVIKHMSEQNNLRDFTILPHSKLPHVCQGCALGKQHKATYPSNFLKEHSQVPKELLHANLCENCPMHP